MDIIKEFGFEIFCKEVRLAENYRQIAKKTSDNRPTLTGAHIEMIYLILLDINVCITEFLVL